MAPYARHGVNVNVDFYSGVVYHLLGIKRDLFVPIFAIGRVPGWAVQVLEQLENNILLRPLTLYNGPDARAYVPIGQRSWIELIASHLRLLEIKFPNCGTQWLGSPLRIESPLLSY